MKLSTRGRYGARALFDMGYNVGDGTIQLREIAERQDISQRYLEQIFQDLKAAGLVTAQRGPKGGYRLARSLDKISLGDILRATDNEICLVDCTDKDCKGSCPMIDSCATQSHWAAAASIMQEYFDKISLAQLCAEAKEKNIAKFI